VLDQVCKLEWHCAARRHGRVVTDDRVTTAPDAEREVNSILACVKPVLLTMVKWRNCTPDAASLPPSELQHTAVDSPVADVVAVGELNAREGLITRGAGQRSTSHLARQLGLHQ
jgi:hypothetical protein